MYASNWSHGLLKEESRFILECDTRRALAHREKSTRDKLQYIRSGKITFLTGCNTSTCTSQTYANPELHDFQISSIRLLLEEKNGKLDEISNVIKEVVDLTEKINLELDSDEVQGLLDPHNQELKIDKLIEMPEQDIEKIESSYLVQSED
ncbi:hypothetical protein TNCV_3403171 [Trichonephila clavipes]|nr:hypothetical protein TNCV_3403171 [Trichonephila clavipes]